MRRKQLAKRVAIAVLSAATVMTAAPVGAFAAQTTSIEASDAAASTGKIDVADDVNFEGQATKDQQDAIKAAIADLDSTIYWDAINKKANANGTDGTPKNNSANPTTMKEDVEYRFKTVKAASAVKDWTVTAGASTSADSWNFTAMSADGKTVVNVTVNTGVSYAMTDEVKNVLDYYFANVVYDFYAGKSVTTQQVASDLTTWAAGGKLNGYTIDNASKTTLSGVGFAGSSAAVTSDGAGTIKVTLSSGQFDQKDANGKDVAAKDASHTFDYNFKVNVNAHEESKAELLANAIAEVEKNTYPSYVDTTKTTTKHSVNQNELEAQILKDLIAAGAPADTKVFNAPTTQTKAATSTANGTWWVSYGDGSDIFKLTLTYSSDQKLADTDKSVEKFLVGAKKQETTANIALDDDQYDKTTATNVPIYLFDVNTVLSSKLQKAGSKAYATADEVEAEVAKEVKDQLTADKVDSNGVTVTAETVKYGGQYGNDKYQSRKGTYYVLVTASINNDFNGWDTDKDGKADEEPVTSSYYLIRVNTVTPETVKTTSIDLPDQTVSKTGGYSYAKKADKDLTRVSLKATVTPEDANQTIHYYVVDKYGNRQAQYYTRANDDRRFYHDNNGYYYNGQDGKTYGRYQTGYTAQYDLILGGTAYDADGNLVQLADDETLIPAGQTGVVYIQAYVSKDVNDTATITYLRDTFDDNLNDAAYYANAVDWAKATGVASGVGNNLFGVNQTVTRSQFVTWLYRLAQKTNVKDPTIAEPKQVFSDVPTTAYYAAAVEWAKENGFVAGKTATTFAPNDEITRAEIATILNRYYGGAQIGNGSENQKSKDFTDVPSSAYYASAVTWATENGVVYGKTTTTFAPNDTATRAEAITMIARSAGYTRNLVR